MSSSLAEDEDSEEELIGELAAGCVTADAADNAVGAQDDFEHPEQLMLLEDDDEADKARASRLAFFHLPAELAGAFLRFLMRSLSLFILTELISLEPGFFEASINSAHNLFKVTKTRNMQKIKNESVNGTDGGEGGTTKGCHNKGEISTMGGGALGPLRFTIL